MGFKPYKGKVGEEQKRSFKPYEGAVGKAEPNPLRTGLDVAERVLTEGPTGAATRLGMLAMGEPQFEETPEFQERLAEMSPQEFGESSRFVRFLRGMQSPAIAAWQMADPSSRELIAEQIAARERGMAARDPERETGLDVAGLVGQTLPATQVARALSSSSRAIPTIREGMKTGAAIAGLTPSQGDPENFWANKAMEVAGGGALGFVIPTVARGGRMVADTTRNIRDVIMNRPGSILNRFYQDILGQQNIGKVRKALQNVDDLIPEQAPPPGAQGPVLPGTRPTVAEAMVKTPAGRPLQTHQRTMMEHPGGVAARFEERALANKSAREIAESVRNAVTGPMREAALSTAKPVQKTDIIKKINQIASEPGWKHNKQIQAPLAEIKDAIQAASRGQITVPPRELDGIRGQVSMQLKELMEASKDTKYKALLRKLEKQVLEQIKDSIEEAGGVGYKAYLAEFQQRSQAIAKDLERFEQSLKPTKIGRATLPRVKLTGGREVVASEIQEVAPRILSRPMVVANWLFKKFGKDIEPALDDEAARRLLSPKVMNEVLADLEPQTRKGIIGSIGRILKAIGRGTEAKAGTIAGLGTGQIADALVDSRARTGSPVLTQ